MPVPPHKLGDDERPPSDDDRIAELEEHVRGSLLGASAAVTELERTIENEIARLETERIMPLELRAGVLETRLAALGAPAEANGATRELMAVLQKAGETQAYPAPSAGAFGAGPDLEGEPGPDDDLSDQRVAELCKLDNTWGTGNLAREVKRRRVAARLRNDRVKPILTEIKRAIQELRWGKPGDAESILVKLETTLSPKGLRGASGRREGKKGHGRFLSGVDEDRTRRSLRAAPTRSARSHS